MKKKRGGWSNLSAAKNALGHGRPRKPVRLVRGKLEMTIRDGDTLEIEYHGYYFKAFARIVNDTIELRDSDDRPITITIMKG